MTQPTLLRGATLPAKIRDLAEPPTRLYVHGTLPRSPGVAIVGTRRASEQGAAYAATLAGELARAGINVLSGGARGIDTAAHEGALAVGGTTVVVAPSSFDRPYPEENAALYRRIVERGGAYVSAFEHEVQARPDRFFLRNALLVALADVVVVVEAAHRSGAINAAKWARDLGRPLFAVPHSPWHAQGRGCVALLRQGAEPLAATEDLLRCLSELNLHPLAAGSAPAGERAPSPEPTTEATPASSRVGGSKRRRRAGGPELSELDQRVLRAVVDGADHPDAVVEATGAPAADVGRALLMLTLMGLVAPDPTGGLRAASAVTRASR